MAQGKKYEPPLSVGEKVVWLGGTAGLGLQGSVVDYGTYHGIVSWIGKIPEIGSQWTAGVDFVRIKIN